MKPFLISGLINVETTLKIEGFPLEYNPVHYPFFGIQSRVSGVGYNIARALTALEQPVLFLSIIGHDFLGQQALESLSHDRIPTDHVIAQASRTAQSVILYDSQGRRQIHVDLKDVQEKAYPPQRFRQAMTRADVLVLCNINFSRPHLKPARAAGKLIVTDVHALSDLEDSYNREFMEAADVLFMSDMKLPDTPERFGLEVMRRYKPEVLVICMSDKGAMLFEAEQPGCRQIPAVITRPVVNTIGAGDALLSAFICQYAEQKDAYSALCQASVFASYKIGAVSTAEGFLDRRSLQALYKEAHSQFDS